jgi:uncharacterized protein
VITLIAALFVIAAPAGAANEQHVTLHALAVVEGSGGKSSTGTTNAFTVSYGQAGGSDFRVGFSEDEVAGTGDQWTAAGWNAAAVATILNGAPLSGVRVDYDVNGRIDGPSAGALMTVGLLSLMRGDKIKPGITMTGTINPDGTVGPVGGIPYKVDGAKQAKAKTMLIPLGQRNSADDSGDLVDVVDIGQQKGVKVKEVGDVYEAYKAFTGKTLPRPKASSDVRLNGDDYRQIKAKVKAQLADFQASAGEFNSLAPAIQNSLTDITSSANDSHTQAQKLTDEGLQAGAYNQALAAAGYANAAVKTGQLLQIFLTQGADAFTEQVKASTAIDGKVEALVDQLKAFHPKTVSDASDLISAYSNTIDAISLSNYAENVLTAAGQETDPTQALTKAVLGAVLYEIAGTQVQGTNDIFEIGKGAGGAKLAKVNVGPVSAFFRKAAEANLSAFNSLIVDPQAQQAGVSADAAETAFGGSDFDYALAQSAEGVLNGGLDKYLGSAKTANYAKLGGAVQLYTRTAGLLSKYYSLGEVNDDLEVTGISNDQAMQSALDLGRGQVQRGVGVLRAKKVSPTLVVGSYEIAGVDASGNASDKLDALGNYLNAFVGSRVLAYLGGFPTTGVK